MVLFVSLSQGQIYVWGIVFYKHCFQLSWQPSLVKIIHDSKYLNINHPFKQKFHNLILFQATQPVKKVSSGTKRKASLMDKSCKDHTAKKQKMTEAKPSTALSKPTKKPDVKWIKW